MVLEKKGEENKERLQPKGGKSQKQSYQLKDCEDGNLPKLMKIEKPKGHTLSKIGPHDRSCIPESIDSYQGSKDPRSRVGRICPNSSKHSTNTKAIHATSATHSPAQNARPPRVQTHRRASARQPTMSYHVAPLRATSASTKPLNGEPTNRPPTTTDLHRNQDRSAYLYHRP